jgi:hypothetical protein
VDAVTLDGTLDELRALVVGRHLSRPRLVAADAVAFEITGARDRRLWIDAGRATAGLYWLSRDVARALAVSASAPLPGRARQALLHLRKRLDGARLTGLRRIAGERTVLLETADALLVLRLGGAAPALSLVREGTVLATLGDGPELSPLPTEAAERDWDRIDPVAFEAAVAAARADGRSLLRAQLLACPGLGPGLARELDGTAASLVALRARLAQAGPSLVVPGPREAWHDADLIAPLAVALGPLPGAAGSQSHASWLEAGALFLEARRRGLAFERERRAASAEARRRIRRLEQLAANLAHDLASLADPERLRREAEALVAHGRSLEPGRESVVVPDPYDEARPLTIALDPRYGGLANAERRFDKARRVVRARQQVELRLRETRSALAEARELEVRADAARERRELLPPGASAGTGSGPQAGAAGPRHYLTSRGLSVLVGRNARENHHLTFRVARAEDLWLHAREAPGAHVIVRDPEGRAGADDLREAAEVAAFCSEAKGEALVDVHVTRRKHVKPARGGPGRVFVSHSDTLRVRPRDPEGRLRRR